MNLNEEGKMQKKQISNKYRTRKVTEEEDKAIKAIQQEKDGMSYLEAKNQYFEGLESSDAETVKSNRGNKTMTIGETKLGVTLVITKEQCKALGFDDKASTKEVVAFIKAKLGIKKKQKGGE